jgi:hypothetical protein
MNKMTTPTKEQIKTLKIGQTVYFCDACGYVIASMIYDKKRNTYFVKNHAGEKGIAKREDLFLTEKEAIGDWWKWKLEFDKKQP